MYNAMDSQPVAVYLTVLVSLQNPTARSTYEQCYNPQLRPFRTNSRLSKPLGQ